jgi:hypothetical protein
MSKIIDDFKVFQDVQGLVQIEPGQVSQNGSLITVESLLTILADSTSSQEEKDAEIAKVGTVLRSLETQPGLTIRNQGSTEYESMDNTIAILTYSGLFDQGRYGARMELRGGFRTTAPDQSQDADNNNKFWTYANILSLWQGPKYVWNNQHPDLFCNQGWFGRSPAMLGIIKMVQGKQVNPFLWISVMVGQFLGWNADPSNTDARKLPYVLWQYLRTRSFIWEMAYQVWVWLMMKKCTNGMKTVYAFWYRDPAHPMNIYPKESI